MHTRPIHGAARRPARMQPAIEQSHPRMSERGVLARFRAFAASLDSARDYDWHDARLAAHLAVHSPDWPSAWRLVMVAHDAHGTIIDRYNDARHDHAASSIEIECHEGRFCYRASRADDGAPAPAPAPAPRRQSIFDAIGDACVRDAALLDAMRDALPIDLDEHATGECLPRRIGRWLRGAVAHWAIDHADMLVHQPSIRDAVQRIPLANWDFDADRAAFLQQVEQLNEPRPVALKGRAARRCGMGRSVGLG